LHVTMATWMGHAPPPSLARLYPFIGIYVTIDRQ
jgi:hypothetical protein